MCHILIIEDEPIIAADLGELMLESGASTLAFASSENAAIASACSERPAVILSDVRLTEGTGPDAVRAIMAALGPIPVIFITASPEACATCSSPLVILTKPFRRADVVEAFRSFAHPFPGVRDRAGGSADATRYGCGSGYFGMR